MSGTVTEWISQFRSGDRVVAERLWGYFSPRMIQNLVPKCRQLKICDEEDIVLTAFQQLLEMLEVNGGEEQIQAPGNRKRRSKAKRHVPSPVTGMVTGEESIENRREFWRFLRIVTKRKLYDWVRYDKAKCRGGDQKMVPLEPHREELVSIPLPNVRNEASSVNAGDEELEADLAERLHELMESLQRPEFKAIIEMKLKKKSNAQIAAKLNISLRMTQYHISEIKAIWHKTFRAA